MGYCEVGEECWWGNAIVSADGKILTPLGEIQVLGKTTNQLAQLIEQRLSKYHRNPSVRVHVTDPNKYYVDGEVNHQGSYCLDTPTTVLEALDISGGLRKQANPKKIRILRGTEVLRFNYKQYVRKA